MAMISGFSFIHNGIDSGYPFVEAVKAVRPYVDEVCVVDMESTDGTREILDALGVRVLHGYWGTNSGIMLDEAYEQHMECQGDVIIQFEADEVFDDRLLKRIMVLLDEGLDHIGCYRIQIEQNFQRCKWYPEPVHRVFPKFSYTRKAGHTTTHHDQAHIIPTDYGYLWDISNCFRDHWIKRIEKMAEYRAEPMNYLMVPIHCNLNVRPSRQEVDLRLNERYWTWTTTPFNLPAILKPLVGKTKYEAKIESLNSWR